MSIARTFLVITLIVFQSICFSQETNKTANTHYQTPYELVDDYYALISAPKGEHNWEKFENLFLSYARIHAIGINEKGKNQFYPQSLDEYLKHMQEYTSQYGFFQTELDRTSISYLRVADIQSLFESRNTPTGEVIDRGLFSFQLVYEKGRWWIASLMWNSETIDNPLPLDLLKLK